MAKQFLTYWQIKFRLLLLIAFFTSVSALAQTSFTITGTVNDKELNSPLPGVGVKVKDTDKGTVTDFDGKFSIDVEEGTVLEFVSIGFKNQIVVISGRDSITVTLEEDNQKLNEVIVVGYGTQKRKNVTGSIVKVSGKDIENRSLARLDDALVGKVAGIRVQTVNGEAGSDPRITVRGTGSISGTSSPLIVVDGIPLGTDPDLLGSIDSNNIESIEVLKDASSVAIFGSRGANGVVIVTLKSGKAGDTKFSFNTYTGYKYATRNDNYNTSIDDEEARLNRIKPTLDPNTVNGARVLDRLNNAKAELAAQRVIAAASGGETDWQEIAFPGGNITSHSFAASGGTENTKFNASIGYLEDEGIAIIDEFKKYNARVKLDSRTKNKKIKFGINLNGQYTEQDRIPNRFTDALRQSRFLPTVLNQENIKFINRTRRQDQVDFSEFEVGDVPQERAFDRVFLRSTEGDRDTILTDENGNPILSDGSEGLTLSTTGNVNPFALFNEKERTKDQAKILANAYLEFKLAKGLKFRQSISGDYRNTRNYARDGLLANQRRVGRTLREERNNSVVHYNVESLLKYKRDFGNHSLDAVGGFSYDEFVYREQTSNAFGVFEDDFTVNIPLSAGGTTSTDVGMENLVSYFGRVNYDYDDRYLLSLSARTDGSSRFGIDTKFGFFPAASIGWRVSNENFIADSGIGDVVTEFKVRASYGVSGSNDISRNIFNSLFRSQSLLQNVNYGSFAAVKRIAIENPDLGWEQLIEFNPGVDLEFGNGVLGLTLDYYERTSEDLILFAPVPGVLGADRLLQNIGEVKNSGFEIEARSRIFNKKNFSWNVAGQLTSNRNEVISLGTGGNQIISSIDQETRPTEFVTRVGEPITSFFGWVFDREIPIEKVDDPFARFNAEQSNVYVKDLNNDGVIDDDDRTLLGSPYPDFEWGFTSDFTLYNFDFGFSLQGSHGAEVRVADIDQLRYSSESTLLPIGPNAARPELGFEDLDLTRHRRFTDAHIQDASFVALRNVSLGYTIPKSVTEKLKIDKLRIYLNGENLLFFTADGYTGFNPEAAGQTSQNANTPITFGYQRGDPPIARTVSMGLNLQF